MIDAANTIERGKTRAQLITRAAFTALAIIAIVFFVCPPSLSAEIFINRTGVRQMTFGVLTDGSVRDTRNDPVPDFNAYIGRTDAINPIEWTHRWDLSLPSDGSIQIDADEVYNNMLAAELFPVIWDIDYPVSTEDDRMFWDKVPYAGATGALFDMAANPGAVALGRVQGNNAFWGAKRISLNTALLAQGVLEYFWLQVDVDPGAPDWFTSIDYSDLAIIFNPGNLAVSKTATALTGFTPPRVGYTTQYRVRINIVNPTLTSTGGPMYDVLVTDKFPAGSTILAAPGIGSASIDAAGNLTWNVGILQDGGLNAPPAAGSADFMDVLVNVTPTQAQIGANILLNAGATITGAQTPLDPGDGTGNLYPFNFHAQMGNFATATSVTVTTANVQPANAGSLVTTASILPGAAINITVTDIDLNTNNAAIDNVTIQLANTVTGETENVSCAETGVNTGIFTCSLATAFGTAAEAINNGSMNIQAADTIRATYNEAVDAAGNPQTHTSDTLVTGGATGALTSTSPIFSTNAITAALNDSDLNTNPATIQNVIISATNARTGETESITLTETGPDTGIFTAILPTALLNAAGANNDGSMNCVSGDSIIFTYNDALLANGNSGSASATTLVIGGSSGTISATPFILPGQPVSVTVVDFDLNTNPALIEGISILITNTSAGETETALLIETAPNSGVFSGSLPTTFGTTAGASNNGSFVTQSGHTLTATYGDALTTTGGAAIVSASTAVIGGGSGILLQTASIIPGQSVTITLSDSDLNANPAIVEIYTLVTTNTSTGESENLSYTETGINTGVFTVTVPTVYGAAAGANNNGTFNVQAGATLSTSYADALTAAGGSATLTASTAVLGGTTAAITSTAAANPGQTITVTLSDNDLNTNPAAVQSFIITATNLASGEIEALSLTETGPNTGVFTITVPTKYAAASVNNDGIFSTTNGNSISFAYNDALTASGGSASISSVTNIVDDTNFVTIASPSGLYTTAVHNVTGNTDPLSNLRMNDPVSGGFIFTAADANGNYTFAAVRFPEGITTFTVTSVDPAGNTAAAAASVLIDTLNSITIVGPAPQSTINLQEDRITGSTDAGSTVTIIEPGSGNALTTTADASGNFTFPSVEFTPGQNTILVTSIDTHGNTATNSLSFFVDRNIYLDISTVAEGQTYPSSRIEIAGTTDPLSTVVTTHPVTGQVLTTTADSFGRYTFGVLDFIEGPHSVNVSAVDPVGNQASTTVSFNVDTTNYNDLLTSGIFLADTIDITGNSKPDSTVTMRHPITSAELRTTTDPAGTYTFRGVYFIDGSYILTTTSVDTLGNIAIDTETILIDSTIVITVTLPPDNSIVSTSPIAITGTTDPGSTVTLVDPATDILITVIAGGDGSFTFPAINLNNGTNHINIITTSPGGNSISHDHTVTFNPNVSLSIETPENGSVVRNPSQSVSGTTDPGSTLTMTNPVTGAVLTTAAGADGRYTFTAIQFPAGANTITVTTLNPAGFTASASSTFIVANTGVTAELIASQRTVFGKPISIQVTDRESYFSSTMIDSIKVLVTNPATGDSETVTLLETTPDSGVFRGLARTAELNTSDGINSGTLSVNYGDTVTTTYIDAIQADGSVNVPLIVRTLITNDELVLKVNIISVTGQVHLQPLSSQSISILEFDARGQLTGNVITYTTGPQGNVPTEFVGYMFEGYSYRVLLNGTINGNAYSHSREFTLSDFDALPADNRGVRTLVIALDPSGYVYDAISGVKINAADVTLFHADGTRATGPFSFFTNLPSRNQTNPQLSGDSGIPGGFEFIGSGAATDITAGYYYITVTFDTTPALGAAYSTVTLSQGSWAGIQQPYTGQLFLLDQANQPIGMRVPLVPANLQTPFSLSKTSNKDSAAVGDIITFTVTVRNISNITTDPDYPVTVRDTMLPGLTYLAGSATYSNGAPVAASQSEHGKVFFTLRQLLPAGNADGLDVITFYYQATVDTSASPGIYLNNSAVAMINFLELSNTDTVIIRVIDDPIFDRATLLGKVFNDINGNGAQDSGEKGIPGAGILLDDGTYITTDENGKYSAPGAMPGMTTTGLRAIKIDTSTLPAGATLTTNETVFATLNPGGIDRADFGVIFAAETAMIENLKKDKPLFLAMFDYSAGEVVTSGAITGRPDREYIPSGGYSKGRAAWFYSGKLAKHYSMTSAYDSNKRHTFEIAPDRDRDLYYPSYGDNSSIEYLTKTQGKFYLDIKSDTSHLLFGNYTVSFDGTSLAAVRQPLSGAMFGFADSNASSSTSLTLYGARRGQLRARDEFRTTGGSRYYLSRSRAVSGSENVWLEIRNEFIPDKIVARRLLQEGTDYEIDYYAGAIRLLSPVPLYAESDHINHAGAQSGDPLWLTIEYIYDEDSSDYGTYGARALQWFGPAGFGLSHISENIDNRDHKLSGADFHLKSNGIEFFTAEFAKSESGGIPWAASLDGGASFVTLGNRNSNSGSAFKVNLKLIHTRNLTWENYINSIAPDFTGSSYSERGIRRYGTSIAYETGSSTIKLDVTRAVSIAGASDSSLVSSSGGKTSAARASFFRELRNAAFTAEFIHRRSDSISNTLGTRTGTSDSLAFKYERIMTDRITLIARQQLPLAPEDEYQSSLGVKYKMNNKISFIAEGTLGPGGSGGRLGFERRTGKNSRAYIDFSSGYSTEYGAERSGTVAGVSGAVSGRSDAFAEYESYAAGSDSVLRRTVGLNTRYRLGAHATMTMSFERGTETSSLNGQYVTNSASVTGDFTMRRGVRGTADIEFRSQRGGITKNHFSIDLTVSGEPREDLHTFAEYSYNVTEDVTAGRADSKYTKALLGLAWRPVDSNRLNAIARAGRIRELTPRRAGEDMMPDSISNVFSIEGIYDLNHAFTLHDKIAFKVIKERVFPLPAARSDTLLMISGFTWRPARAFDIRMEYRANTQRTAHNNKNGTAIETGYTFKGKIRAGIGYNASTWSSDEFTSANYRCRGVFFRLQGKF